MRILLDTNILFSALISDRNERFLINKAIGGHHTFVVTDLVEEEIESVIAKKLPQAKRNAGLRLLDTLFQSNFVYQKTKDQYKDHIARAHEYINQKDVPILAAGLQEEIDILVSGDKDFLENPKLRHLRKTKILTTAETLRNL